MTESNKGVAFTVSGLSVNAGSRRLLDKADANFRAGEISIIVGPSGVGKSVLLKILAGLIGPSENGISIDGKVFCGDEPIQSGKAGVVFQSFALFDELTPKANLDLANSSGQANFSKSELDELLAELKVPTNVPTSRLSGGQRQRLAIARTLAYDPPAILYDEPTSGLDPKTGIQVAELIRTTHDKHQKTSIIVTHDYPALMPIADRVFLFDPIRGKIDELAPGEWAKIGELLEPLSAAALADQSSVATENVFTWIKKRTGSFFAGTTRCVEAFFVALFSLLPIWKNARWGFKFFWHFSKLVFGSTAILYLGIAGLIVGFVATYFTFEFLPFHSYTEPLLVEDLLAAVGFATYRIFVPVLATILIAARSGAAVTADIGGRQYGNQIDAMKTFGISPRSYQLTPIMLSFLIGTPLLTMLSFWAAKLASLMTFVATHAEKGPYFWQHHYHRQLDVLGQITYFGTGWLATKLLCCGLAVGMVSYFQGISPKFSTSDVSRSVTRTILWSTLLVLMIHFVYAFWEFEAVRPQGN